MKQRSLIVLLLLSLCTTPMLWGQEPTHTPGQSIELTPNQWATFSPGVNITIPQYNASTFPVYVASASLSPGDAYLITHQLNANGPINIESGTGLLMKMLTGESSCWFDFSTTEASPTSIDQNVLYGTTEAMVTSQLDHHSEGSILALNKNTQTFCVVNEEVKFPAFRAYIAVTPWSAPSFRLITEEELATGFEPVEPFESLASTKFWRDGQLLIWRDGVVYDVMGRIVSH